jgi:hypothetical protein
VTDYPKGEKGMQKYVPLVLAWLLGALLPVPAQSSNPFQQLLAGGPTTTGSPLLQQSPSANEPEIIRCYTVENEAARRKENPALPSEEAFEQWMASKISERQMGYSLLAASVLQIPVIVHVVHNGEAIGAGPNISAAQVYSQIESLNEDLRRLNGDRLNTRTIFEPVAADLELEFVPATVDPQGNQLAEPGIRRYHGKRASWDTRDDVEKILKPATIWDPTRYSNMWTANFGGTMAGLLGYAQFPESSGLAGMPGGTQNAQTDGNVMVYTSFGNSAKDPGGIFSLRAPYNLGRTTTHEVGHWLGLRHIWGDGGCTVDDFVTDTPTAAAANNGCATTTNSCSSNQAGDLPDMVENYMDYSNDGCMNIFTAGQKARTQTVMLNSPRRKELPYSTVAGQTYHDAGITSVSFSKDCAGTLVGTALLTNFATRGNLMAATIYIEVNGTLTGTLDWTGNLQALGSRLISLPHVSVGLGTHSIRVYTANPNGQADENNQNNASSTSITTAVLSGNYSQNFETGIGSLSELVMIKRAESNFGVEAEIQSKSSLSLYLEGNSANGYPPAPDGPTTEEAFNPAHPHYAAAILCYDATNAGSLQLSFDYYLNWGIQDIYTNFRYRVVSDKGSFVSQAVKPVQGDVPWTRVTLDLSPYVGGNIQIYFEANCKFTRSNLNGKPEDGNAVYIDNIAFSYTTSLPEISFATTTGTSSEANATTEEGCRRYTDYTVNLNIANAPNSPATVAVSVAAASATALNDYSLLTPSVVFPAGSTSPQPVKIRVYDDTEVEGEESLSLELQLSGQSNAVLASGGARHVLTILDNDTDLLGNLPAGSIFSESFPAGVPDNRGWHVIDNVAAGSANKWFTGMYSNKGAAYIASNATATPGSYVNATTNIRLVSPPVNATSRTGLSLSFDYAANGETSGGGKALTYLDFGQTFYSLDGNTFTAIGPVLQGKAGLTAASIPLPTALEGKTFYLAWNWTNNTTTNNNPALILQNIRVEAAARPGTSIATTLNQQQQVYLGAYSTIRLFDQTSGDIIALIENPSSWDYGCTSVVIDRSGLGSKEFWNVGIAQGLADKTVYITPANNNPEGHYAITLYYSEAEIAAWEQQSGKDRQALKIAKISGAHIKEVSPNKIPPGATGALSPSTSLGVFGTGWAVSGSFSTGFSGFGVGDPGLPPIILLPVELLWFSATPAGNEITLRWATAMEKDADYFELEHSTDGQAFAPVARVAAAGTSNLQQNYSFIHRRMAPGSHYYRLRMVDTDASYEYSNIVLAQLGSVGLALQGLYPNPARDKVQLRLSTSGSGLVQVQLLSSSGVALQSSSHGVQPGLNQLELSLQGLLPGLYLLKISHGTERLQQKLLIH